MSVTGRFTYLCISSQHRGWFGQSFKVPFAYVQLCGLSDDLAGSDIDSDSEQERLDTQHTDSEGNFILNPRVSLNQWQVRLFLSSRHQRVAPDGGTRNFTGVRVRVPDYTAQYTGEPRPVSRWSVARHVELRPGTEAISPAREQQTPAVVATEWWSNVHITTACPDLQQVEEYRGGMWADACHIYRTIVLAIKKLLDLELDPPAYSILKPVDVYLQIFVDARRKIIFVTDGSVLLEDDLRSHLRAGDRGGISRTGEEGTVFHPRIWVVASGTNQSEDVVLHEYGHHVHKCLVNVWASREEALAFPSGGEHTGGVTHPATAFGEAWANMFQCVVQDLDKFNYTGVTMDLRVVPRLDASFNNTSRDGVRDDGDRPNHEMCLSTFLVNVWQEHGLYYIWKATHRYKPKNFLEFREAYINLLLEDGAMGKLDHFLQILRNNRLPVQRV